MERTMKICLLVMILQHIGLVLGEKKLVFQKFEMCDANTDYLYRFDARIKNKNDIQYIDGNVTLLQDLGNDVFARVQSFMLLGNGKKSMKLLEISGKFCDFCKKYTGPFFTDLEKAARVIPGSCPIAKGNYHLVDYPIDLRKFFLTAMIPPGSMRALMQYSDVRTKKELTCVEMLVEVLEG